MYMFSKWIYVNLLIHVLIVVASMQSIVEDCITGKMDRDKEG